MLPLARRRWWVAGAWLLALALVVGSLLPGPVVATTGSYDKVEHLGGYFVLTAWLCGIVRPGRYVWAVAAAVVLGAMLEGAQGLLTETREADVLDLMANAAGATLAWLAARLGLGGWAQRVEQCLGLQPAE